jgi:hypothetical protein
MLVVGPNRDLPSVGHVCGSEVLCLQCEIEVVSGLLQRNLALQWQSASRRHAGPPSVLFSGCARKRAWPTIIAI